ncbi:hypothetical protein FEM48_Zijuj11G0139100 [Ziziphus jujuba var. spinosa]|uniref:Uncharacterized protein n=1 Tax=Ziziphus jujuba var. spinosa TaxID=714518 RepID=A0A978UJB7_ZIZJJ|nr:hypothetical protein FEM48_Zijuj11G0139100 [Ziziphus jujuba var. spinosa]
MLSISATMSTPSLAAGGRREAITEILDGLKKFGIYFGFAKQHFEFRKSSLRLHREWVKGNWVPPLLEKFSFKGVELHTAFGRLEMPVCCLFSFLFSAPCSFPCSGLCEDR